MNHDLTLVLLRARARELEVAADDLAAAAEERAFHAWQNDTLFPQWVVTRVWEIGL